MSEAKQDGGPAFPTDALHELRHDHYEGMSLRDYFAAKAMAALLRSEIGKEGWATTHGVAKDAYKVADAMLAVRSE